MYPPFVLKSQKIEKLGDFYSYRILFYLCLIRNTHTGSSLFILTGSYFIHAGSEVLIQDPPLLFVPDSILFMPDLKNSYRILSFIHTRSEFSELLLTIPESSNTIVNWPLVWELFVLGLKTHEWNWVTDWFHENKKFAGSNIFKKINISLFFIKAKL